MKTMIPRLITAAFAVMLVCAVYWGARSLRQQEAGTVPAAASTLKEEDRQLIRGCNEFGKALFLHAALEKDSAANVLLSPYSIATALSLVYNGADGTSAEEMARVLHYPMSEREAVSRSAHAVLEASVRNTKQTELRIANSMWLRKGWVFRQSVLDLNRTYYNSDLQSVDFTGSAGPDKINGWVSKHTNGKISRMVEPPINPDVISILLNAVYYKGAWTTPFEKSRTSDKPFKQEDGTEKPVPMMSAGGKYMHYESEEVQAVRLPYGDGRLGMTLYVPGNKTGTLGNLAAWLLQDGGLEAVKAGLQEKSGTVALPRFKLEFGLELKETLIRMGMKQVFDPESTGLNGMVESQHDGNIYISTVLHKTFMEVNEQGTEAAAATKVELRAGSAQPAKEPFRFTADRPFFFTIEDQETGLMLFMGTFKEPKE